MQKCPGAELQGCCSVSGSSWKDCDSISPIPGCLYDVSVVYYVKIGCVFRLLLLIGQTVKLPSWEITVSLNYCNYIVLSSSVLHDM